MRLVCFQKRASEKGIKRPRMYLKACFCAVLLFLAGCDGSTEGISREPDAGTVHTQPEPAAPERGLAGALERLSVGEPVLRKSSGEPFFCRSINITAQWINRYQTKSDIDQSFAVFQQYGINTLRISIYEKNLGDTASLDRLETLVQDAADAGFYSILHMQLPPGAFPEYINEDTREEDLLFSSEEKREQFTILWRQVAVRFAANSAVLGYSLCPAPALPYLTDAAGLPDDSAMQEQCAQTLQQAVDEIRAADREAVLILPRPATAYYRDDDGYLQQQSLSLGYPPVKDPLNNVLLNVDFMMQQGSPYADQDMLVTYQKDGANQPNYVWYDDWAAYSYLSVHHGSRHTISANLRLKDGEISMVHPILSLNNVHPDAVIYFDNLRLEKESADGSVKLIVESDFQNAAEVAALAMAPGKIEENPFSQGDALSVYRNPPVEGLHYSMLSQFILRPEEKWILTMDIRVEGPAEPQESIRFKMGVYEFDREPEWVRFDRNYLSGLLEDAFAAAESYGAPVFVGRMGIPYDYLSEISRPEAWLTDTLSLLQEHTTAGFSWDSAASDVSGLWMPDGQMHPVLQSFFEGPLAQYPKPT